MTPEALRAVALSFPGAHEEPHFDRTSFRVGKKIFATMTQEGDEAMVKATPEGAHILIGGSPDLFFGYGGWTSRGGAVGVRLGAAPDALMTELLTAAWRAIAPKPRASVPPQDAAPEGASKPARRRETTAKARIPKAKAVKAPGSLAPTKRTHVAIPDDFAAALARSKKATRAFDAFAPSCRREYLAWITSAKRAATRAKRVAEAVARIATGATFAPKRRAPARNE
jgi:hypothetical protein